MVLNDREIIRLANEQGMIDPFVGEGVSQVGSRKVISFGVSSFGYDARLAYYFKIFTPINPAGPTCVDPKDFNPNVYQDFEVKETTSHEGCPLVMPPHSFLLGSTIERFRIPRNVVVICVGKSTYARCGIIVNVTPLEPEWEGYVTIEISNTSPLPARIYAGEGICQLLFMEGATCDKSYADKNGKYQNQPGLTDPKA